MSTASTLRSTATRLPERLRLGFFRIFFPLLLGAIAVSEWMVLSRTALRVGFDAPPIVHGVALAFLFALNRTLARRLRTRGSGPVVAGYAAFAFTCVFGGAFIVLAEFGWALARFGAPPAVRLAGVLPAVDVTEWQHVFDACVDLGLAGIGGLFVFGYTAGRRALDVTTRRVGVPHLPPQFAGFRIVHLSDLHLGAFLGIEELQRHVERVNALAPDLICITGDLVDHAATCATAFPVLAGLRARHGVLVTLGNHDVAAGADAVTAALRTLTGFTVLRNARADVEHDGGRLVVLGVDDLGRDWARGILQHPALPPLARDVPTGAPVVVLSHRPDCFEQAADLGACLVLAGHTHGGQIGLPMPLGRRVRNPAEVITRYDRGVFHHGTATLIVSNGLGFTGQPVRLFTPREIGCIELRPT